MPLEVLDPLFSDPRFTAADGRKKAEARQKLWGGYLLADPQAAARFDELPDEQRKQVVEEFYRRADDRYRDAFTVEVAPATTIKRKTGGDLDEFGVRSPAMIYDEAVPAVRRPVRDLATEDFISQVNEGKLTPDKFTREELLATAPVILEAAPDRLPLWQARAKQVAVDEGVLPADDTWQQSAARIIGTLGGAVGPAADLTQKLTGREPVDPAKYDTPLAPEDEKRFQAWKQQLAPNDSGQDYDLRGAFQAGVLPGKDGHWPDSYKKPNHPTFSDQSVYAKDRPDLAGHWEGDRYTVPDLSRNGLQGGIFQGLLPDNRALVALAYPDANAFKTAGTLLSLGGASASFGSGLTKAGVALLSKKGIALQAAADAALGYAYRHEAPGILASALGKPDDGVLNSVEAGAISGLFGLTLRAIDKSFTLKSLKEASGYAGTVDDFRDFLKRQAGKLAPPVDSAPNKVVGAAGSAEEGARVPNVSPDELQGIGMPTPAQARTDLAAAPDLAAAADELAAKAREAAGPAAVNGPALQRLQEWPKDPEVRALLHSEAAPDQIADALVRQEPGQPLPMEIKQGDGVVGGSIPEQLPSIRAAETGQLFGEDQMPFNLASETRPDADKLTQAAFDRTEEAQRQSKLFDVPPELPPGAGLRDETAKPPVVKPAASDAASSSDSIAGVAGGRTGENQDGKIPPKVKKGRTPGLGTAPDGEQDLLSHIEELGGIGGPGKHAGGEYDGFAETFNRGPARLLRRRGASSVDQLIGELADRGYKFDKADEFYSAVNKAVDARTKVRGAIAKETHQAKFAAALFENAGRPAELKAPTAKLVDELHVGDSFKVRGEPVRVTEINPDTYAVKVDGAVSKWIDQGTEIYPDRGYIKRPRQVPAGGDTPFNIEQATLPRRISAPLITADAGPVSLAGIREYLSKALDIPVRLGVNRRQALGFFRTKEENIRLKMLNDIPTLAHEVGHYLHKLVFPGGAADGVGAYAKFAKQFDGELLQLGARTSRKSYSQQQIRMEGVAEFTREYLTDRSQALAKAPKFTAHFEDTLQKGFPEIWKIVSQAREDLGRYINQTPAMKVRAMISRSPAQPGMTIGQRLEKFYSDWVTELRPIDRNLERLVELGLPPAQARQASTAATNYVGGWRGKVEHDLFKAQTDLAGNKVGEPLRDILRGLDDNGRNELGDYMVAKRAIELGKRGIKSGVTTSDAIATVQLYQGKYERTRLKLLGFQHRNLQLLEQSGFFTPDKIDRMRELNKNYVPFYRIYETVAGGGGGSGRGFANLSSGVKQIKGSDRLIADPLESILRNAYTFRDLAERNLVGRKFVAAVEEATGGGRVADRVVKRITGTKVPDEEIKRSLMAAGIDEEVIDEMPDLSFTLWKAARTEDPSKGIFKVWKNGQERFYQTDDKELVRSLLLMDSIDAGLMGKFPLVQMVRPLTRIKRAGATLALEFIARNPFRDSIQAGVYSKYGFVPFFDGFKGMLSALKKDQYYWDWIKSGGRYSDFVATDRADLVKTLKNVTANPGVAAFIQEHANPLNILNTLQKGSELMEMGTRIGEFRRGVRAGANPVEAANAAKDISLNFARAGFKGKVWNQLHAFYNAGVQDVDKLIRAHREAPARTTAKAFAYITLPTIGAWYLGKDDPAIQQLPDWRKMLFWNINLTDAAAAAGIPLQAPWVASFPKPFLLGHLYGTSVEKALDYAHGKDPNAVNKWFAGFQGQLPVGLTSFIPDAGLPLLENATNHSFFRQAPIVNQGLQALPVEFQSTPQTSQVAQLIGQATGTSPMMIDNLVRGYGAGLGKYATDSIDWFLAKTNLRDMPTPPATMIRELPGIRAFIGSPYAANADLERFYTGLDLAEKRLRAFSYFGKEISTDSEKNWWDKNRNEIVYYDQKAGDRTIMTNLRGVQKNLSELSKAMVQVQQSRSLSPESKRSTLLELKRQRDTVAAAGFQLLHPADQKAAR